MASAMTHTSQLMVVVMMMVVGEGSRRGVQAHSGKVLLVSMDGFRWDYVDKVAGLRHFPDMVSSGCRVDHVENQFATITFPCHYSIATGLYEESHGIVANRMYDRKRKTFFKPSSKESYWWEGGEPIWITLEKQRRNSTGVLYWAGSEVEIRGLRPSLYLPYSSQLGFEDRVRTGVSWFTAPYPKDLVVIYFDEPDATGHKYGPNSPQVAAKVKEMDGILGLIMAELKNKNLTDVVNVIVTSDHGMTEVNMQNKLIDLWKYVNKTHVEVVPDSGPVTAILPKPGQEAEVVRQAKQIPHVTVYRREEIPDHFHYRNNADRIMPVIVIAEEGWTLSSNVSSTLAWNPRGNHGYSNLLPSMKPIFFARGPDFRKGVKSTSIRSVDIYPLMCRLLNIRASPNNGSLENTAQFLVGDVAGSGVTIHCGGQVNQALWRMGVVLLMLAALVL